MAPRRRKTKRRRSRAVSLLNVLESYTYASILSQGVAGTTPLGMITGDTDLGYVTESSGAGMLSTQITTLQGQKEISLGDIISNPTVALSEMTKNLQANLVPMAIGSLTTGIAFRFGKRLLRRPIGNINRNIMKPLLGAGIKL